MPKIKVWGYSYSCLRQRGLSLFRKVPSCFESDGQSVLVFLSKLVHGDLGTVTILEYSSNNPAASIKSAAVWMVMRAVVNFSDCWRRLLGFVGRE